MAINDERWHRWIAKFQACLATLILFLGYGQASRHASPWKWQFTWLTQFLLDAILLLVLFGGALYLIGCAVAHHQQARHLESRRNAGQR